MARKRKSTEAIQAGNINLGEEVGLTIYQDVEFSSVVNRLPTMFPQLDYILGGGLPFGRMVEVIGKNASGKSTFAVSITRVAQMLKIPVVWIDVEGTADPVRLSELGVDFEAGGIYMVEPPETRGEKQPLTVEVVSNKLEEVIKAFAESGKPFVIIWDSVAQTPAEKELEKGVGSQQPGL